MRGIRSVAIARVGMLAGLAVIACASVALADRPKGEKPARKAAAELAPPAMTEAANDEFTQPTPAVPEYAALVRTGRMQIVQFNGPAGAEIDIASSNGVVRLTAPAQVGLAVGPAYRLRVSNIPEHSDWVFYPSIQLVGYTMPPANVEPRDFPVPIHFLTRDFEEVAAGKFVRNAVYLEDPNVAFPMAFPKGEMPVIDLRASENPLQVASDFGRPIAAIQIGNRLPTGGEFESAAGAPPVYVFGTEPPRNPARGDSAVKPAGFDAAGSADCAACESGSTCRGSRPLCQTSSNVVRQPYKVHSRMPFDEFLCDGGDEEPFAHLNAHGTMAGLGASETVAKFTRGRDGTRVVASNQTCLYAPRFGLVRTSLVLGGSQQIDGAWGVGHTDRRAAVENRAATSKRVLSEKSQAFKRREKLSVVAVHDQLGGVDEMRVINGFHQHEGSEPLAVRIRADGLLKADDPRIAARIQAARLWNRPQSPSYTAITEGGSQISGYAQTGETQQVREANRKPGELFIWKVATPDSAQQGDLVEFAVYYKNLGQQPVDSVSIMDNLTTRLEYDASSAKSDRRAVFTATPNDVQSHELRWDILEPIKPGEGGVVWFQCKVR